MTLLAFSILWANSADNKGDRKLSWVSGPILKHLTASVISVYLISCTGPILKHLTASVIYMHKIGCMVLENSHMSKAMTFIKLLDVTDNKSMPKGMGVSDFLFFFFFFKLIFSWVFKNIPSYAYNSLKLWQKKMTFSFMHKSFLFGDIISPPPHTHTHTTHNTHTYGERGHIGFGIDPVGAGVTLSCLHNIL